MSIADSATSDTVVFFPKSDVSFRPPAGNEIEVLLS
jgi:hypothetical protein